jgi:hypothetical protein
MPHIFHIDICFKASFVSARQTVLAIATYATNTPKPTNNAKKNFRGHASKNSICNQGAAVFLIANWLNKNKIGPTTTSACNQPPNHQPCHTE